MPQLLLIFATLLICSCNNHLYTLKHSIAYYNQLNKEPSNIESLYHTSVGGNRDTTFYIVDIYPSRVQAIYADTIPFGIGMYMSLDSATGRYYDDGTATATQRDYPELIPLIQNSLVMQQLEQQAATAIATMHQIGLRHYRATATNLISYTGYPDRYISYEWEGKNKEPCCCFRLDDHWFYCDKSIAESPRKKKLLQRVVEKQKDKFKN